MSNTDHNSIIMRFEPPISGSDGPREVTIARVKALSPWLEGKDEHISAMRGGIKPAKYLLEVADPERYGQTRNHLEGAVTTLSPYISRGVISPSDLRDAGLSFGVTRNVEKFIQQIAWRDYWQATLERHPHWMWEDAEDYKTGFTASDYADELPEDVARADTGVACIDQFLSRLLSEGWIHNHARLYVAAYICHWRRVKWQAGARFFLSHLLDAEPASNNLSWQWVASTFAHKPYYFNLDNVRKFSGSDIDTRSETNTVLEGSYEDLSAELFPNMEPKR